jgi:hypothetical protein
LCGLWSAGNVAVHAGTVYPGESGNSTCFGGTVNRSSYWAPSVIDTRFGRPIVPDENMVYYKQVSSLAMQVAVPPPGLRILAGDATASAPPTKGLERYRFSCLSRTKGGYGGRT